MKAGIVALDIGLVVLGAHFAAEMVWTWARPSAGQAAIASYSPDVSRPKGGDYRLLTTFDPFHRQAAAPQASQAHEDAARETTLDLKLFGVRADVEAGRDDRGSAIIRTADKKQGAYRLGDTVMDGVTLKRILPDRVVISHRGVLENLFLDEEAQTLIAAAGKPDATAGGAARFMAAVKAQPRITGGGIDGFVLNPGKDKTLFSKMGFAPGDVLVAVNGSRLSSVERVDALKENLRNAQSVRLEIERDGTKRIIELSNE
jgi:general secretion pathway protein C